VNADQKKTGDEIGPETEALMGLLGRLDATYWPLRGTFQQDRHQIQHEMQRDWRTHGLPLRTTGASTVQRKQEEQLWRRLEQSGLVTISRSRGRRTHVKFTPVGEAIARVLAATGSVVTEWPYFARFVELSARPGGKSLSEAYVADCVQWTCSQDQLADLTRSTFRLLPYFCAGWVSAWPDHYCRYWLSLTDEGRAAFEAEQPNDDCPDDIGLNEAASDAYERTFSECQAEMSVAKPRRPNSIICPQPCGISWEYEPDEATAETP